MRIAIWTEKAWALGRIHEEIVRCIPEHQFSFFDWRSKEECEVFFATYQSYDILLGNTAILFLTEKFGKRLDPDYIHRCLAILHCPVLHHEFYDERIPFTKGPTYLGVSPECSMSIANVLRVPVKACPFGINPHHFPRLDSKASFEVAGVTAMSKYKNTDLLQRVCDKVGLSLRPCDPKDANKDLYSSFDVFLCASPLDAGPLGNFEAAALGIPVLSTRVGNWAYVPNALFFETEEEAVAILQKWKEWPDERVAYAQRLSNEIHSAWTNDILIRTHLLPVLESFGFCTDVLDIGASVRGTHRSIHVDPLAREEKHLGRIERAAIVETPVEPVVYFSSDTEPDWIQGCARVGHRHPSCKTSTMAIARVMTFREVLVKYQIRYIDQLSLVVEGYEVYIVQAVLREISNGLFVRKIKLLWNELTNEHEKAYCKYILRDYPCEVSGSMLVCTLL